MNELILKGRGNNVIGANMYFYSYRTLMIYYYEVVYQISNGIWNCARYPNEHWRVWNEANLYKTKDKSNSRTVVETGCSILKNDYNLKRILNLNTSYSRVQSIGKLAKSLGDDYNRMIELLNLEFYEYIPLLEVDIDMYEVNFDNACRYLLSNYPESRRLLEILDEDVLEKYYSTEYSESEMRDDLGMIQVTMRNIENQIIEL